MATNLALDPQLIDVLEASGARTKKEAVTIALREYLAVRERATIVDLFGTIEWDTGFDHQAARRSRDRKLGLAD
ncbi:type II toxin-antitoxin system VapB family antitoxin [Nocardioides sp. L-11A]|uniref:type II toxin-antitoxin system VapB family antitoxin n=1 Tax=Nocardioides sp. L-11A TaxID=3043848 RepID=UPI00249C6E0C|nr:type II toxin-antitoxin system VapB family antitoxin [Nocardioides sp. L-11A]